ncbi:MAG: rod shape-determining protein MreC [Hyphomonadaceae bacterium]
MARRARSTSRKGFRLSAALIVTVALIAAAGVGIVTRIGQGGPAASSGDDLAAAGAQTANGPFRAVEQMFRRVSLMWSATERVEALERENRDLRLWRVLAERLAERNERYEALLRMSGNARDEDANFENAIGAQLVLDSGGPFMRTLVANAGAEHGVRVGYVAINENGLVGRVVSVGRRSARVLLLDDYNSRVPVMGAHSRVRAVLAGQAAQPPELLTAPFQMDDPRLDYVTAGLREGEPIITSGDGGVFPRGIRVGFARQGRDGEWRVALAASQKPIDFVRLVPFEGADAPERSGEIEMEGPPPQHLGAATQRTQASAAAVSAQRERPARVQAAAQTQAQANPQEAPPQQQQTPQPEAPPNETPPPPQ